MKVTIEVSDDCIEGALYGAFDSGGIRYWGNANTGRMGTRGDWCLAPMSGGWLEVTCTDPLDQLDTQPARLNGTTLRTGLQLMAEHSPVRFADLVAGRYDANVGDVLVQYAVFGKVVFG
jgi:hypothetical protein